MSAPHVPCRVWEFLLVVGLILRSSPTAGQPAPPLPVPPLTQDVRGMLAEAARDSLLAPWQREFMSELVGVEPPRDATVPVLPGPARASGAAADDGVWTAILPPTARTGHAAIHDPVRQRMVVVGGNDGGYTSDVWALGLSGSPTWSLLATASVPPLGRAGHTAVYDPVRDRMLVFGGVDAGGLRTDQLWALSLSGTPQWSGLAPPGTRPSGRMWHTAIYDPIRDRLLVFGGTDGNRRNDVWALPLAANASWIEIAPAGIAPSPRFAHTAIYDPVRDRMVVFGGADGDGYRNDVWALSLAGIPSWAEVAPAATPPSGRYFHGTVYDPVRDGLVTFGGFDGIARDDVWALSLAGTPTWSALAPAGNPPAERSSHATIYDPTHDRLVAFGGESGGGRRADTWGLSLAATPEWSVLVPWAVPPSPRYAHTAIYDPPRDRMVVVGGSPGFVADVWQLSLAGTPVWAPMAVVGSPPAGRFLHTAIYDPPRDRLVVFGGHDGSTSRNDTWTLSLAGTPTWAALAPAGSLPAPRHEHAAIYDPVRDRMLVFGGQSPFGENFNDVWALSLAGAPAWTALAPAGSPPAGRRGHSATYDPIRDRMVVFAGSGANDTWALSLPGSPAWSPIAPAGSPPSARSHHTAIYDPPRDRLVVLGGYDGNHRNDLWALSLAGSPAWSQLAPAGVLPAGRQSHTAIYDPMRDRMVAFGGWDGGSLRNDAWALVWTSFVSTPAEVATASRGLVLAPPRPNPSRDETLLDFALPAPARVALEVFDAHGRRVRRIADGWFAAGRHHRTWPGDDDHGGAVRSGVYVLRLQAGGMQATRRIVRIR